MGTPDEIVKNGLQMYAELSPETKEFFDFMVNNNLMDLTNRKGKAKRNRKGGGMGHRPDTKRAIVTLAAGDSIDLFEN